MSKFEERYKERDLEKIVMEDVTFHVNLPTSANRRYERAVASSMAKRDPVTGEFTVIDFDMVDVFDAQHKAFLKSCVVKVEGPLSFDFDPDEFFDKFPEAAEDLYNMAVELATKQEGDAIESAGKSQTTSDGQGSGKARTDSTPASLKAAG